MRPAGFEPATHSLEGCCSIQLSYGRREGNAIKYNGWGNQSCEPDVEPGSVSNFNPAPEARCSDVPWRCARCSLSGW